MAKLTDAQKAENARERVINTLKCYQIGNAKNRVAKVFQQMIRAEHAAQHDGILHCCTCSATGRLGENKFDAGHFLQQRRASVIFCEDPPNCHAQCKECNLKFGGRPDRYEKFMIDNYGEDAVERLKHLGRQDHKFTHEQLADLLIGFRARLKVALARLGA